MPLDITVTFADGSQHVYQGAPDDLTPEQASSRAQQEFGKQVTALDGGRKPGMIDQAVDVVKNLARGFGQGAAGNINALETNGSVKPKQDEQGKFYWDAPGGKRVYASDAEQADLGKPTIGQKLGSFVEKHLPTPQDSGWTKYARKATEAVGGGLMFRGGAGAPGLVGNATGGMGSEASASMFGEGPLQRFLGGLVGGAAGSAGVSKLTAPRVQEANIAREALEGITPQQLQAAQAMQAQAARMGVQLDLAQALTAIGASPNNLNTIRDLIANTKEGNKTQTLLRNQPTQVNEATRFAVDGIPGKDFGVEQAANNLQEAATKRVSQVAKERTNLVREDYAKAGMLPEAVQRSVITELEATLKMPGLSNEARGVAQDLLVKFKNAPQSVDSAAAARDAIAKAAKPSQRLAAQNSLASANSAQTTIRPMHALDADVALSDSIGSYKGTPTYLSNPKATGQVKGVGARVNDLLKEGSPEIAAAEAKFAGLSNSLVNPVKQGPVGTFATSRGYFPDRAASATKLVTFFDNGVSPSSANSPIRTLGKELNKVDPGAFQDAFKSWIVSKVDKHAAADLNLGQAQPDRLASGIYEELFRSPKRYQGVKDAVATIAEQNKLNPVDAVRGLENLGRVLKGAANRPRSVQGVSQEQLQEMAGHSLSANALRVFGFLPFERIARWREGAQAGATFKTFDELLTSPEGAATLARLGKTSVMSPTFGALLQGFETGTLQTYAGNENLKRANAPGITPP